ncbi:GGDEF domain-containing protein [Marinobacter sp. SS21]|uniref:GGDEF domain-containing protein n=1 Tax=Marinobacter sp. SS21 TaxID=2979460 RepID=UPI00232C3897|nr:GGDEF domain-containing protein [Marinobacter sp. SS21]MDC0664034.1 GGDEF domain-containing protein [Marinobacter sp. SS21]
MPQLNNQRPDHQFAEFRVKGEIPVPVLITWLTCAAVPVLCFFAFRAYLRAESFNVIALLLLASLLAANSLVYLSSHNGTRLQQGFIVLITALFSFLALSAIEDGTGVLWLFAYPPLVFYISDARVGIIACIGGWSGLALLFSPVGKAIVDTPYSASFSLNMIIILGFEMATCYVLDQSRRRSKLGLIKLANQFEYAAKHDALTGLANRREGHARLNDEYERYLRNRREFSTLLMDIDLFKSVNDNFGHQAGDRIILLVANTLKAECRRVDTLARWGGEEFLVLLPETSNAVAVKIANRIRESIASQSIEFEGQAVSATISVGVATIQGAESIDRLLQRADEALYQAKSEGRNKVCGGINQHSAA